MSGLGRPVDPDYPTNRLLLGVLPLLVLAGAVWSLARGGGFAEATLAGVDLGLLAFVCWALTRELDPDGETAGLVAVAPAAAAWTVWGTQAILVPAALLISARLVNRSTGKAAEPADTLLVTTGFVAAAWWVSWSLAFVAAGALLLDAALAPPQGQPRRHRHMLAAAVLLAASAPAWIRGVASASAPPYALALLFAAAAATASAVCAPAPASVGDVDRARLRPLRVRLAAALGAVGVALAGFDTSVAPVRLVATWSCVLVAALAAAIRHITRRSGPLAPCWPARPS